MIQQNKPGESKQPQQQQSDRRGVPHLADYFAILREHKHVALIPFFLIIAASVLLTLLATPVYKTSALLEIETRRSGSGLVEELNLTDSLPQVETEMEIMRSRRVAQDAAKILVGDPSLSPRNRGMSDFFTEVNKYHPLYVMLRAFGAAGAPCKVEFQAPALSEGAAETYHFLFKEARSVDSYVLEVRKLKKRRFRTESESVP